MLTGDIRNQIDKLWNAFWTGGISNPLEVIEQITYLLFLRRLDVARGTRISFVDGFQGGKSFEAESDLHAVTIRRVLKVSAVTGMAFRPFESKPVSDGYEPPAANFVRTGDFLFSRANTTDLVGAVAYVHSTSPNLLLSDKIWRFTWRKPVLAHPLFVWALFQTAALRREIGRRATGSSGSMKNISQEKVLGIVTIRPPMDMQVEFARRAAAFDKLKATHRASLAQLDALFASLQHRAFRGEL